MTQLTVSFFIKVVSDTKIEFKEKTYIVQNAGNSTLGFERFIFLLQPLASRLPNRSKLLVHFLYMDITAVCVM